MENKKTAFDLIKSTLLEKKIIDNYSMIDKRVTTRLSDAIFKLRNSGLEIETVRGRDMLKPKKGDDKNTYYKLIEK